MIVLLGGAPGVIVLFNFPAWGVRTSLFDPGLLVLRGSGKLPQYGGTMVFTVVLLWSLWWYCGGTVVIFVQSWRYCSETVVTEVAL